MGRPFSHLSHNLLGVNPLEMIHGVLKSNRNIEMEVVTDLGDCFLMRIQPYHIAQDVFSGVVLTFIDINAYHAEHTLLQSVLDTMLDAVIIIDEDGKILQCNPAIEKILGHKKSDVLGESIEMIIPSGPDRKHHAGYIQHYLKTGEAGIIGIGRKVEALCSNGDIKPVHLSISEVKEGERRFFTAALRNLGESK